MPLYHLLLETLPSKGRGRPPGSLPWCRTPHDSFRTECLDKWSRRQDIGLDSLASRLSRVPEHVYAGPMGVCGTYWSHSLWQSPLSTVPDTGWLPFVLRPTIGPRLQAANMPPGGPFSTCTGDQPLLLSIYKECWGACEPPALGLGLICWAGGTVGSGTRVLGSPEESDVGGPQQDFLMSTLQPPPPKISLLSPRPSEQHTPLPPSKRSALSSDFTLSSVDIWLVFH